MKKENKFKLVSNSILIIYSILLVVNLTVLRSTFGTLFYSILLICIIIVLNINRAHIRQINNKTFKIIRISANITFLLFLASFIFIETLIIKEYLFKEKPEIYAEYVVILGAGLEGEKVSRRLEQRLLEGVDYLARNKSTKVIVSGGQGDDEDISEAEAMGRYLIESGIDGQRIYYEEKSTSTLENLLYSGKILRDNLNEKKPKILIITSDYHMFRARMISRKIEIQSYGITSKSELSFKINSLPREYFAVIKDYLLIGMGNL